MDNRNAQLGFTLIELLVVISIIGFLASTVLVSLNRARVSSRNAQRISEVKKLGEALDLYRQERGVYPQYAAWVCLGPASEVCWNNMYSGNNQLVADMGQYITRLPKTYISSGSGMNRLVYGTYMNTNGTRGMTLNWFYEGVIPAEYCPMVPGARGYNIAPGTWGGTDPALSLCMEMIAY